jgi:hypothetical protein
VKHQRAEQTGKVMKAKTQQQPDVKNIVWTPKQAAKSRRASANALPNQAEKVAVMEAAANSDVEEASGSDDKVLMKSSLPISLTLRKFRDRNQWSRRTLPRKSQQRKSQPQRHKHSKTSSNAKAKLKAAIQSMLQGEAQSQKCGSDNGTYLIRVDCTACVATQLD